MICYMAAFAISDGYGEDLDEAWATYLSTTATDPDAAKAAEGTIVAAWMQGLKDLEGNEAFEICDPDAKNPNKKKERLADLERVGTCLKGCCGGQECSLPK